MKVVINDSVGGFGMSADLLFHLFIYDRSLFDKRKCKEDFESHVANMKSDRRSGTDVRMFEL